MSTVTTLHRTSMLLRDVGVRLQDERHIPPDITWLTIDAADVWLATDALVRTLGARFLISVGTDNRECADDYRVTHIFSDDVAHEFIALDCPIDPEQPRIESITSIVPGAAWSEQEFHDLIGVEPEGHPDPRRLVLPDDWPPDTYPLRRDFPYNYRPAPATGEAPEPKKPPPGATVIPIGPFFPVLEEPARLRVFVEGETVVGCDYRGFYNHRGIEKLGDSVLTYERIPYLAERICGICGFVHSTAYCQAVEKAAGVVVPRRAEYIRTIMLELERIHSHLLWLGIAGHIIGFDTVLMQTWRIREPVMWLTEEISGNRKTYGMNMVGGVRRDISAEQLPRILEIIAQAERESTAVRDAIIGDTTLHARTRNVGTLTSQHARDICVVGPPARAARVPIDARLDHPYAAYDAVVPRICTSDAGDTWARVLVRICELQESIRLVREAVTTLPDGPTMAEVTEVPDGSIGISVVEAPRGEAVHFVRTGGPNRPYRWRVRAPTYPNLQALPAMLQGQQIADVPIILGSLDPCFSCTERYEVVNV